MNMKKIFAGVMAFCMICAALPLADVIPKNIVVPFTALAADSGVVNSGTT